MIFISILDCFFDSRTRITRTIIICTIFLTSSVHACWLYNYWFSASETSEPESASLPKRIRSSSSFSESYMSRFSSSSSSTSSENSILTEPPDPIRTSNTKSQQSFSDYEPQPSILKTYSVEVTSTEDDSSYAYDGDDEASNSDQLKTPSSTQRDSPKPDLNCIIFDDSVCSITCNQVCLLYNYESRGICTENKTCYCTVISMKKPSMTYEQYENQSLDDLWFYKFVKSTVSTKVLNQIKKFPSMVAKLEEALHKPLRTGDDVKNRLITAYPEWTLLNDLKSRRRAPINRFIDDHYKLNESGLEKRIKRSVKKYKGDIIKKFSSNDYLKKLTTFLDTLDDEDQLKNIFRQVNDSKVESLIAYVKNYIQNRGLDFSVEDLGSYECDYLDVDYIDNIVAGAIVNSFLQMNSDANSKPSATNSALASPAKSSKRKSVKQTSSNDTQNHSQVKADQCSCPSKSVSNDLDDGSRWELPGFPIQMFKDYPGSVDEVWQDKDYYVKYRRWSSGTIDIEWRKGKDNVIINIWSFGSIDQKWYLNGASITLKLWSNGSVDESWKFGDVSYTFKKWSSGSTERKWANNRSDPNILGRYQQYILDWCNANYFLIEMRHCVIY